jgi:hypothetical protein
MLNADSSPAATFMVNVDGKTPVFQGRRNTWAEEVDYWLDPKTNQINPSKWHIWKAEARNDSHGMGVVPIPGSGEMAHYLCTSTLQVARRCLQGAMEPLLKRIKWQA